MISISYGVPAGDTKSGLSLAICMQSSSDFLALGIS